MRTKAGRSVTIEEIDEALADLAILIRAHGEQGMEYLPIFERLERERERLVDVDARIDAAIARVRKPKGKQENGK